VNVNTLASVCYGSHEDVSAHQQDVLGMTYEVNLDVMFALQQFLGLALIFSISFGRAREWALAFFLQ
jgi:hypothetical protein